MPSPECSRHHWACTGPGGRVQASISKAHKHADQSPTVPEKHESLSHKEREARSPPASQGSLSRAGQVSICTALRICLLPAPLRLGNICLRRYAVRKYLSRPAASKKDLSWLSLGVQAFAGQGAVSLSLSFFLMFLAARVHQRPADHPRCQAFSCRAAQQHHCPLGGVGSTGTWGRLVCVACVCGGGYACTTPYRTTPHLIAPHRIIPTVPHRTVLHRTALPYHSTPCTPP